ncbi:MAG: hypothetical protein WBD25_14805 [Terriglobales bacterium]|jgi:hypothetical protein
MTFLTPEEVREWCEARGLKVTPDRFVYYDTEQLYCFSVGLEDKASSVIALADYLVPTWPDVSFGGALLWIRQQGIWGDFSETTGAVILEQMRLAKGETAPVKERPGHLFRSEELFEMHSYFVLPLLFGWDAFLIPEGKDYLLFVSHDGVVGVVSRTQESYDELYHRVRDWKPREEKHWYSKHVSPSERKDCRG